jgi:hypothetical protein
VKAGVGASGATDLAELNPGGGVMSPPERIPFVMCWFGFFPILFLYGIS